MWGRKDYEVDLRNAFEPISRRCSRSIMEKRSPEPSLVNSLTDDPATVADVGRTKHRLERFTTPSPSQDPATDPQAHRQSHTQTNKQTRRDTYGHTVSEQFLLYVLPITQRTMPPFHNRHYSASFSLAARWTTTRQDHQTLGGARGMGVGGHCFA